jgi:hypothetical protein
MENFIKKLVREPLPVEKEIPGWGFLQKNPPDRVGAVLSFPKRYDRCRIYVTELGWKLAKREGALVFREGIPELKRRWNRVGVKCRNNLSKRWAERFWMIIRSR